MTLTKGAHAERAHAGVVKKDGSAERLSSSIADARGYFPRLGSSRNEDPRQRDNVHSTLAASPVGGFGPVALPIAEAPISQGTDRVLPK